jgi:hypothetical protein
VKNTNPLAKLLPSHSKKDIQIPDFLAVSLIRESSMEKLERVKPEISSCKKEKHLKIGNLSLGQVTSLDKIVSARNVDCALRGYGECDNSADADCIKVQMVKASPSLAEMLESSKEDHIETPLYKGGRLFKTCKAKPDPEPPVNMTAMVVDIKSVFPKNSIREKLNPRELTGQTFPSPIVANTHSPPKRQFTQPPNIKIVKKPESKPCTAQKLLSPTKNLVFRDLSKNLGQQDEFKFKPADESSSVDRIRNHYKNKYKPANEVEFDEYLEDLYSKNLGKNPELSKTITEIQRLNMATTEKCQA